MKAHVRFQIGTLWFGMSDGRVARSFMRHVTISGNGIQACGFDA